MPNDNPDKTLSLSFKQAGALTKKHAKTFYFASHFLPAAKRKAAYSVYALCRLSDEAVDSRDVFSPQKRLEKIKANLDLAYQDEQAKEGILPAFQQTIRKYQIPRQYFLELLAGMKMDLEKTRYRDFSELYDYCYKAAGVVGLIMLKIFGYQDKRAEKHAVDLGAAMQLTNILRDIKEDYERGRIYLPTDEMKRFGVTEDDIAQRRVSENFVNLLKFQIERAHSYYASAYRGIPMISDSKSRFVARAMGDIYSGILNAIEKNNYDVFSQRAHVSTKEKIIRAGKIFLTK